MFLILHTTFTDPDNGPDPDDDLGPEPDSDIYPDRGDGPDLDMDLNLMIVLILRITFHRF